MGELLLGLVVAAIVFGGVAALVTGRDPGLLPAEPDGRAVPLPGNRSLRESDLLEVRFDTAVRGYRMAQVDQALRRAAYDIGYKEELIAVLEAEVTALREGRMSDAETLRRAREAAQGGPSQTGASHDGGARTADTPAAGPYGRSDGPDEPELGRDEPGRQADQPGEPEPAPPRSDTAWAERQ